MNFDELETLPKKINPCPIAEAIVEIWFDTTLPHEALAGIVYNSVKEKYSEFSSLGITQLPADFIESQINLRYAPHYKLTNADFIFQIGPRSFSLVCPKEYKGWSHYFNEIDWILNKIKDLNIIQTPKRLSIRYVNFFKDINIFEKIKTDLSLGGNSLIGHVNTLRTEFDYNDFHCVYQITNNSLLQGKEKGSSIDIDLIYLAALNANNFKKLIEKGHELEKKLFFGVLKEDFLATLSPEY